MKPTVIRNALVVGPKSAKRADILIEDGIIARMGVIRASSTADVINADGMVALPGFIDIHTHGGRGFDSTQGRYDPKTGRFNHSPAAYAASLPMLSAWFARSGVSRAILGLVAAPEGTLKHALSSLAEYVESSSNGSKGARFEGTCLEGTFLRHAAMAGAQNPDDFHAPDRRFFDSLNKAARGTIKYVNVVPEYGKASVALTRYLTRQGILVGAGHTNCPADQARKCVDAGLKLIVHFLNGPTGHSYKPFHGGNMVEMALGSDIHVELICDGYHVAPSYVRDVVARKGLDKVVLVTDAMFLCGMKGVTDFTLRGKEGVVARNREYIQVKKDPSTLFGSVLTMSRAFSNALSWLTCDMRGNWRSMHRAMPLESVLPALACCAAANQAGLLGWDKTAPGAPAGVGTGSLEPGKCADIVLGKLAGRPGAFSLSPSRVFVSGRPVL